METAVESGVIRTVPSGRPNREVVDVLATIVLMFITALGVALGLACVVLLLAAPATAAEPDGAAGQTMLVPMKANDAGQGTLLFRGEGGTRLSAPLLATDVQIHVSGPLAHTRVEQTFRNPADAWFEGIYVFPLPENAAVSRVRLRIGDRLIEAEIQERQQAQATYQAAKSAGQRAALVEQERPNLFTTSVANIGPRQEITVELEYRQQIDYRVEHGAGHFSLRFPMVVGPRYIPGASGTDEELGAVVAGAAVPDARRISPPVLAEDSRIVNPVSIHVNLDAGAPIDTIESPFHDVEILRLDANRRQVRLSEGNTPANRDFELRWRVAPGSEPLASLFFEPGEDGAHYALLTLMPPPLRQDAPRLPREVIFVIDTSGSMEGEAIVQAREALQLALRRLHDDDAFNVIAFSSTPEAMFPSAFPATTRNVAFATSWVGNLHADGGTEMAAALEIALEDSHDEARVRQVVFLTDGAVGNEAQLFELIQRRLGRSRLFTIGIGSAPNSYFMRKAAQFGRGSFTYIGRTEDVKNHMAALFERLESPLARDIRIQWPAGAEVDMWPERIPDLYLGEPIVLAARLDTLAGDVVVEGQVGGQAWSQRVQLDKASLGSGVGSLWARRRIDGLMDRLSLGADEAEVRAEVLPLALEHQLVTRYTSFVAVDKTPVRPAGAPLAEGQVPTHMPHGWSQAAVFGELPRGATDSRWLMLTGFAALALAGALLGLARRRPEPVL
ncbi:MAG: marine proteobacterial sortase target protein [Rhodocyclaceae bacterium]|nr:marine proteobacterial sortase target protein [Rhodocyclaceae bacterium]